MPAFNEKQVEGFAKVGERIGDIMQDRWWKKEAENFQQSEMAQFQSATSQFYKNIMMVEDGDQMAQEFQAWNSSVMMPFMTNATAKYGSNPYIMQVTQQVFQANQDGLTKFLGVEAAGHALKGRDQAEGRETQTFEAGLEKTQAETEAAKQHGPLREAQAHEAQARGDLLNRTDPNIRAAGSDKTLTAFIPPGTQASLAVSTLRRLGSPEFNKARNAEMNMVRQDMATAIHAQNVRKGGMRPDGLGKWGTNAKKEIDELIIPTITIENVRHAWERNKLTEYYGPEITQVLPQYAQDDMLPQETIAPLSGAVKDSQISERLLGTDAALGLQRAGINTGDIQEFISALPGSYEMIPEGPMRAAFDLVSQAQRQPNGTYTIAGTNIRFKSYNDLVKALNNASDKLAIEPAIGGLDIPDSGLESDTRQARKRARKLRDAMVKKYAAEVARALGIAVPAGYKTILGTGAGAELLRGAGRAFESTGLGGLFGKLTEGEVEIGK